MSQAAWDFLAAIRLWRTLLYFAMTDTAMHYKRSVLGPFWLTLNMAILVMALGLLYSTLFKTDVRSYLPYVSAGILTWGMISALINEGCHTFVAHAINIKNTNMPLPFFPLKTVTRQAINTLHHIVVMVGIYIVFPEYLQWQVLYAIAGFACILIFGIWATVLVGMLASRFRDVPNIVTSFLQVWFFITPVFWPVGDLVDHWIVQWNVFYHFVEILRAPLLGNAPLATTWLVVIGFNILGILVTMALYKKYAGRVVYTL